MALAVLLTIGTGIDYVRPGLACVLERRRPRHVDRPPAPGAG